jgi:hypothetical protein
LRRPRVPSDHRSPVAASAVWDMLLVCCKYPRCLSPSVSTRSTKPAVVNCSQRAARSTAFFTASVTRSEIDSVFCIARSFGWGNPLHNTLDREKFPSRSENLFVELGRGGGKSKCALWFYINTVTAAGGKSLLEGAIANYMMLLLKGRCAVVSTSGCLTREFGP